MYPLPWKRVSLCSARILGEVVLLLCARNRVMEGSIGAHGPPACYALAPPEALLWGEGGAPIRPRNQRSA